MGVGHFGRAAVAGGVDVVGVGALVWIVVARTIAVVVTTIALVVERVFLEGDGVLVLGQIQVTVATARTIGGLGLTVAVEIGVVVVDRELDVVNTIGATAGAV